MNNRWNDELQVVQVRIARPTDKLIEIEKFYCEGIGLKKSVLFKGTQDILMSVVTLVLILGVMGYMRHELRENYLKPHIKENPRTTVLQFDS